MRKIILILVATFAVLTFAFSGAALADCGMCDMKGREKGEVINITCPVMGGAVDKDAPYKTEYKGKTIGFCCPGCVEEFKKNPEKYMAKLEKGKCMIKCPNCGTEIDVMKECKKAEKGKQCPMM